MSAGSIVIDLLMRTGSFETDTGRAEKRLRAFEKSARDVGRTVTSALAAVGAGLSFDALITGFNRTLTTLGNFKDLAEQTGISVESLSAIEPVARGAGMALEGVAEISGKLTKALAGVDDETKGAGKALAAIGLDAAKLQGLGAVEQLTELARALNQYADDANKVAIVQGVLGKTGAAYLPFLKDLAEAGELNATVTAEQARAADDYGKALAAVQGDLASFGREIALGILPPVRELLAEFRNSREQFNFLALAGDAVRIVFETLTVLGANLQFVFVGVGREIGAIAAQLAALARLDFTAFKAIGDAVKEDGARARAELDAFTARVLGAAQAAKQLTGGGADARPSAGPFRRLADDAAKAKTAVRDLAIVTDDYDASLRRALAEEGNRRGVDEIRALADAEARRVDELDRLAELTGGLTRAQRERLQVVGELYAADRISEQQLEALTADVYGLGEATKETKGLAEELGFTFSSAFEDAIVGGKKFSEVLNALGQDILRILTRKLVTAPLADAIGGLLNGLLPGMASGGPVSAGVPYLVGERGPELIIPRTAGTVLDAQATAGLGRGGEVTLNVMNYGSPVRAEQRARQTPTGVIVDLVLREVEGDVRRGGRVSSAMQQQFGLNRAAGLAR